MVITSKNNPLIKETASLNDKKGRKALGLFLVEGIKLTTECIRSGLIVERVLLSENCPLSAQDLGIAPEKIVRVKEDVFLAISDEKTPQGVLCRVEIPKQNLCAPSESCLILDGVADPGNMGAIIRTANAAGYKSIYLTPDCTDPYSPKSVRASMSGIFSTKIYVASREELLKNLQGVPVLVADMSGKNVFAYAPPPVFALVIGNEANGVSEQMRSAAYDSLKIPMDSAQESLNAAVAAGILMYLLKRESFKV